MHNCRLLLASPPMQPPLGPALDDFRTTYHPRSNQQPKQRVDAFGDYNSSKPAPPPFTEPDPWKPFRSKTEFEFADIVLQAALTRTQINQLLKVVHTLMAERPEFHLKTHSDLQDLWEVASERLTGVSML